MLRLPQQATLSLRRVTMFWFNVDSTPSIPESQQISENYEFVNPLRRPRSSSRSSHRHDEEFSEGRAVGNQAPRRVQTLLSPLLTRFIQFKTNEYSAINQFCTQNPGVLVEDFQPLQAAAQEVLLTGDANAADAAERMVHRYRLLSLCSRLPNNRQDYIAGLVKDRGKRQEFNEEVSNVFKAFKDRVSQISRQRVSEPTKQDIHKTTGTNPQDSPRPKPVTQNQSSAQSVNDGNLSPGNRRPSISIRPLPLVGREAPQASIPSNRDSREMRGNQRHVPPSHIGTAPEDISLQTTGGIGLDPIVENELSAEVREVLNARYRLYTGPKDINKVFGVGSVIAVFWHENYGRLPSTLKELSREEPQAGTFGRGWVTYCAGPYEAIYSHVRRFIIIRKREGFSVGIPITSYGGKGLKKKKLHEKEQHAHTIVYALGRKPASLDGEPRMIKPSICINMYNNDETLSKSSRLYYAKPQSIDHNIKIQHLGHVVKEHIPLLLLDYRTENLPDGPSV